MDDDELAAIRNREIGFVFQTFNLLPRSTSLRNVELPLIYAGIDPKQRAERASRSALRDVGLGDRHSPQAQRTLRRAAPARRDRPRAGQQPFDHPGRRTDRQPRFQDRRRIMALLEDLYQQGNTIILVTHEADIARHARRTCHLRDGLIEER